MVPFSQIGLKERRANDRISRPIERTAAPPLIGMPICGLRGRKTKNDKDRNRMMRRYTCEGWHLQRSETMIPESLRAACDSPGREPWARPSPHVRSPEGKGARATLPGWKEQREKQVACCRMPH